MQISQIILGILCDGARQSQDSHQVGDCHKGVEDVGDVPDQIQSNNGSDDDNCDVEQLVGQQSLLAE